MGGDSHFFGWNEDAVAAVTWGFNSRDALHASDPTHLIENPAHLLELRRS